MTKRAPKHVLAAYLDDQGASISEFARTLVREGGADARTISRQTVHAWVSGAHFPSRKLALLVEQVTHGEVTAAAMLGIEAP